MSNDLLYDIIIYMTPFFLIFVFWLISGLEYDFNADYYFDFKDDCSNKCDELGYFDYDVEVNYKIVGFNMTDYDYKNESGYKCVCYNKKDYIKVVKK